MIKLIVENGKITAVECSTPQEAADYARLMQSNSGDFGARMTPDVRPLYSATTAYNKELHDFINKISSLGSTIVSSGTLANALDVSGVQGLGPKIRGFAKKYEQTYPNSKLDDLIYRESRPGEESIWYINTDELKKLNF